MMRHAASPVCASLDGRRARHPEGGFALVRCLHPASQPDSPGQCTPRVPSDHCSPTGLCVPDGPQHHPRLQRPRAGCAPGAFHRNHTITTTFDAAGLEHLQALAHRSPRDFGHPTSVWTLDLLAEESATQGLTSRRVSDETIRTTVKRLGSSWKRAKRWITSPDPEYERKKGGATD